MGKAKDDLFWLAQRAEGNPRVQRTIETWTAAIQFNLRGEPQPLTLLVGGGGLKAIVGPHIKPTIVVTGQAKALAPVLTGDLDITHPIARGEIEIARGSYNDLLNLSRIALAAKRGG